MTIAQMKLIWERACDHHAMIALNAFMRADQLNESNKEKRDAGIRAMAIEQCERANDFVESLTYIREIGYRAYCQRYQGTL